MKRYTTNKLGYCNGNEFQSLGTFLLKPPVEGQSHHLQGPSLEVVMDKFTTLTCHNFMSELKHFVQSKMSIMVTFTALKKY